MLILVSIVAVGCAPRVDQKYTYIETERGLFPFSNGNCLIGMLLNNDGYNILDVNSKPITCSGYIKLTNEEAENYKR